MEEKLRTRRPRVVSLREGLRPTGRRTRSSSLGMTQRRSEETETRVRPVRSVTR